jgi:hypothetical protein
MAIQNAINYAHTAGGGTVYIPAGTYTVSAGLTLNEYVNILGDGVASILLYQPTASPAAPAITWTPSASGVNLDAVLSNIHIHAAGSTAANTQYGILVLGGYYGTIREVVIDGLDSFANTGGAAIAIQCSSSINSAFINIISCRLQVSGDGIQVTAQPDREIAGINIRGCGIQGNGGWGINAIGAQTGSTPGYYMSQVNIEGNDLEGNTKGGITGSFIASRIVGNYYESSTVPFIDLSNIHNANNTLRNEGLVIENNWLSLGNLSSGMVLGSYYTSAGIACVGNVITGVTGAAIYTGGTVGARIENNWVPSGTIVDGGVGGSFSYSIPPAFNSYGLDVRVYRFVQTDLPETTANPMTVGLDSAYAQTSVNMENAGYVLGVSAHYSGGTITSGTYDVQVYRGSTLQIDTGSISSNPAVVGSWIGPSDPRGYPDQFPAGTDLSVKVSTLGLSPSKGNLLVEVVVGFGTAGA